MSWYGESGRHKLAAMGIPTGRKKKNTPKTHEPAQKWARDIIWRLYPDDTGEQKITIRGREYFLRYEGWGPVCFTYDYIYGRTGIEGVESAVFHEDFTSHPGPAFDDEELEKKCVQYAVEVGNRLIKEDWPRELEPEGWKLVYGEHDEQKGQFGFTWALWVRE